jgi:hypothetical protein
MEVVAACHVAHAAPGGARMSALADIQREIDRMMRLAEREAGQPLGAGGKAVREGAHGCRSGRQIGERSILAVTGDPSCRKRSTTCRWWDWTEAFDGFEVVVL